MYILTACNPVERGDTALFASTPCSFIDRGAGSSLPGCAMMSSVPSTTSFNTIPIIQDTYFIKCIYSLKRVDQPLCTRDVLLIITGEGLYGQETVKTVTVL